MKRKLSDLLPMFEVGEGGSAGAGEIDYDNLPDDHQVPLSVVKAIRGELKQLKDGLAAKDDELLLYKTTVRSLQQSGGGGGAAEQPVNDPVSSFFKDRDPDEPFTNADAQTLLRTVNATNAEQATLSQVASQKDFQEVVYTHLPKLIAANPALAAVIKSLPTQAARFALAYQLGKTAPEYLAKGLTETKPHEDATKAKENEGKPRSTASVGASGAASSSREDRIRNTRPGTPEFRKMQEDFKREGRQG